MNKSAGNGVIGGTVNGNGSLTVKLENVGPDAYLNKVIKMVGEAQEGKSRTQHLADRIAFWLTIIALTVGLGTLGTWLISHKPFVFALERMASVMVITCPHALGLAVPLVVAISTSVAARRGLLIRNRTAFENARRISLLALDKTGTLTRGNFSVKKTGSLNEEFNDRQVLILAAAAEAQSEHPLGAAIRDYAGKNHWQIPAAENFRTLTGQGIEAQVDGQKIQVVNPEFVREKNFKIPDKAFRGSYGTVVFLLVDDKLAGFIAMADEIRDESFEAVLNLKKKGIKLIMLTGDNENVAKNVSEALGLDGYHAGILPDQKLDIIREFQQRGEFVAMTGDGINDAPALAAADVGIAVGSGTDIAAETADIILVRSNPADIASLLLFGKETHKKMIQNFVWASGYNVVAIPVAAGVLYGAGILISPAVAALLMSLSTIIVALNAQVLKRKLKTYSKLS